MAETGCVACRLNHRPGLHAPCSKPISKAMHYSSPIIWAAALMEVGDTMFIVLRYSCLV